jgi:hypothetical protein
MRQRYDLDFKIPIVAEFESSKSVASMAAIMAAIQILPTKTTKILPFFLSSQRKIERE